MSRFDNHLRVSNSVLDRLIDYEPKDSQEVPKPQSVSVAEAKQAVRRDLEWLLNTRCFVDNPEDYEEAPRSVAFYGLPDFTAVSVKSHIEQAKMKKAIESAIDFFEPRFSGVKVTLEPATSVDRTIKFRIEATLEMEPNPEPVVFDTVLQLGTGNFAVNNA